MADLFLAAIVGFGVGVGTTVFVLRKPLKLGAEAFEAARRDKRKQEMVRELGKLTNHGQGPKPAANLRLVGARTEIRE